MSSPRNNISDDSDLEPVEEEAIRNDQSEEESEETGPYPVSPNPSVSPDTQPRVNDIIRLHESYFPPSPTRARRPSDARRWDWVPHTLNQWRRQEGSPYPQEGESSTAAQADLVTGEPSHHTIALLIARTVRHETQLEQMEENLEALPPPEFYEETERDTDYLGRGQRNLRHTTEELSTRVERNSRRLTEMERRMDNFEQKLEQLNTLADTSRHYASYILGGHHVPK